MTVLVRSASRHSPRTRRSLSARLSSGAHRACHRAAGALRDERGDVPGWVLVTLMTAGLVVALWTVAGSTLTEVFLNAIAKVTSAI